MRIIWEIADIKPGAKVKMLPACLDHYVTRLIGVMCVTPTDRIYGIIDPETGEFVKVGSGTQEALVQYLNNNEFKPLEE